MTRVLYDPLADAVAICLKDQIARGERVRMHTCDAPMRGSSVSLGFDAKGLLISIEVLGAAKLLPRETLEAAEQRGPVPPGTNPFKED
jgi:hypothetical protein